MTHICDVTHNCGKLGPMLDVDGHGDGDLLSRADVLSHHPHEQPDHRDHFELIWKATSEQKDYDVLVGGHHPDEQASHVALVGLHLEHGNLLVG